MENIFPEICQEVTSKKRPIFRTPHEKIGEVEALC